MKVLRHAALPVAGIVLLAALAVAQLSSAQATSSHGSGGPSSGPNCGPTIYKADGSPWLCTFDDEFSGNALNTSQWVAQTSFVTGGSSVYACYTDRPETVSVSHGALHLSVLQTSTPVWCPGGLAPSYYEAGSVSTYHLFSQEYGRFEARVRVQASTAPGLNEDFWIYPDDRYTTITKPDTGEIDISQQFSSDPANTYPYLHYAAGGVSAGTVAGDNAAHCAAARGVWNTYDLVWTPTSITISVNGVTCLVNTSGSTTFQERQMIVLTQALGGASDPAGSNTTLPATMDVDYVRVWK